MSEACGLALLGRFVKAGIEIPEPVTNGNGTIVVTGIPAKAPTGVPSGLLGSSGDALKRARDARVRISLALKGFETDPTVPRFAELRTLFNRWESAMRGPLGKIRRAAPDAWEESLASLKEGRKGTRAALEWLRQGDFEQTLKMLRLARDHYDEVLETLRRTSPPVRR